MGKLVNGMQEAKSDDRACDDTTKPPSKLHLSVGAALSESNLLERVREFRRTSRGVADINGNLSVTELSNRAQSMLKLKQASEQFHTLLSPISVSHLKVLQELKLEQTLSRYYWHTLFLANNRPEQGKFELDSLCSKLYHAKNTLSGADGSHAATSFDENTVVENAKDEPTKDEPTKDEPTNDGPTENEHAVDQKVEDQKVEDQKVEDEKVDADESDVPENLTSEETPVNVSIEDSLTVTAEGTLAESAIVSVDNVIADHSAELTGRSLGENPDDILGETPDMSLDKSKQGATELSSEEPLVVSSEGSAEGLSEEVTKEQLGESAPASSDAVVENSLDQTSSVTLDESLEGLMDETAEISLDESLEGLLDETAEVSLDESLEDLLDETADVSFDEILDDSLDEDGVVPLDKSPEGTLDKTAVASLEEELGDSLVGTAGVSLEEELEELEASLEKNSEVTLEEDIELSLEELLGEPSEETFEVIADELSDETLESISSVAPDESPDLPPDVADEDLSTVAIDASSESAVEGSLDVASESSVDVVPERTDDVASENSESAVPEGSKEAAREISANLAPESLEEVEREISENLAPESSMDVVPEGSEEAAREISENSALEGSQGVAREVSENVAPESSVDVLPEDSEDIARESAENVVHESTARTVLDSLNNAALVSSEPKPGIESQDVNRTLSDESNTDKTDKLTADTETTQGPIQAHGGAIYGLITGICAALLIILSAVAFAPGILQTLQTKVPVGSISYRLVMLLVLFTFTTSFFLFISKFIAANGTSKLAAANVDTSSGFFSRLFDIGASPRRILAGAVGPVLLGLGQGISISTGYGYFGFSVLLDGLNKTFLVPFWLSYTVITVSCYLLAWLWGRVPLGLGTVAALLLVGPAISFGSGIAPEGLSTGGSILTFSLGLFLFTLGIALAASAALGPDGISSLSLAAERAHHWAFPVATLLWDITAIASGVILGGSVGIATAIGLLMVPILLHLLIPPLRRLLTG